jgi:hypothetical protein
MSHTVAFVVLVVAFAYTYAVLPVWVVKSALIVRK